MATLSQNDGANRTSPANVVFIHSKKLEKFHYPTDHPFVTQRAALTRRTLDSIGLLRGPGRAEVEPKSATRAELETFHTPRYLDALRRAEAGDLRIEDLAMGIGSADCPVFQGLYDYASLACGATLTGARLLLSGQAQIAFNPSGGYHHAGPERASGFCYINDVAIACLELAARGRRVVFLDVDVHHGDGVQNAFYDRSDVMTISLHETGRLLFPGTGFADDIGEGAGEGYAVNVPLPPGTYDEAYLRAFDAIVPPLIRAFRPDVIVLELGMDALSGDPLAHLNLTNNAYAEVIHRVLGFRVPLLVTGGGGYNAENTVRGWALAWAVLCGEAHAADSHLGLGGVLLETTDWLGGLKDRPFFPDEKTRDRVESEINEVIETIRKHVFPVHGL